MADCAIIAIAKVRGFDYNHVEKRAFEYGKDKRGFSTEGIIQVLEYMGYTPQIMPKVVLMTWYHDDDDYPLRIPTWTRFKARRDVSWNLEYPPLLIQSRDHIEAWHKGKLPEDLFTPRTRIISVIYF